jgi:hypothetical protein
MMFKKLFFSNYVANELHRRGVAPNKIQSVFSNQGFSLLCRGLYANGYDESRAADLFQRFLGGGKPAFDEMYNNSGAYGIAFLQPLKDQYDRLEGPYERGPGGWSRPSPRKG